jgi:hypothetical protein
VLRLFNPNSAEMDEFLLPSNGEAGSDVWKALGTNPEGKNGWKYRDTTSAHGPCKVVLVKPGRLMKAVCLAKVKPIAFTLDETTQGELAAMLQLGGEPPYCVAFRQDLGGTLIKDEGTGVRPTGVGLFKMIYRIDPSLPDACPIP